MQAYFSPLEAERLLAAGDRSVLCLSYGWHTGPHPDPRGLTLIKLRRYLQSDPSALSCGLFWDNSSLYQPEKTDDEQESMSKALMVMSKFYASITGTAVLMQKEVPARLPMYDGKIQLFGLPERLRTEAALATDLAQYGTVVKVEILPDRVDLAPGPGRRIASVKAANAIVAFSTHAEAETALADLKRQGRGAAFLYNSTPYEGEGGRGWCLVEKGSSSVIVAHLAKAKQQKALPER